MPRRRCRRRRGRKKGDRKTAALLEPTMRKPQFAINRPSFWGGVGLLILAGVMATRGIFDTSSLSAGLGGVLALIME